jgi:hypothetical protein
MEPSEVKRDWSRIASRLSIVRLSIPLRVLVPSLLISTIRTKTRGASFERGVFGFLVGVILVLGSAVVGTLLSPLAGITGFLVIFWLAGSTGVVMILSVMKPIAFVKPICTRCRLLPVIKEHEAIHISGVESDDMVWRSMKTRHSCESLGLDGDPRICSFCPIPERLRGTEGV